MKKKWKRRTGKPIKQKLMMVLIMFFSSILYFSCPNITNGIIGGTEILWSGQVRFDSEILVAPGDILRILAGTTISVYSDAELVIMESSKLLIEGTAEAPVKIINCAGEYWKGFLISGSSSYADVSFLEWTGAPFQIRNGASAVIKNSIFNSFLGSIPPILEGYKAGSIKIVDCHFFDYYETHFYKTSVEITGSLFENMIGDGIDFDNSPGETTVVKNCTIRNSNVTNVDGIDFGTLPYPYSEASYGIVDSSRIYNISDKGISVGEGAKNIIVHNTLIYDVDIGVSSKDNSRVTVSACSITNCNYGFKQYQERSGMSGGQLEAYHCVVWGNNTFYYLKDGSKLTLRSCYYDNLPVPDDELQYSTDIDASNIKFETDPFLDNYYTIIPEMGGGYGADFSEDSGEIGNEYSFFVAGHVYGRHEDNLHQDFIGIHPEFVNKGFPVIKSYPNMTMGFFVEDIAEVSVDWEYDAVDEKVTELGIPVFFSRGNHDMGSDIFVNRYGRNGKCYYSFVHENNLFIVLDSQLVPWDIEGEQLIFLKDVIAGSGDKKDIFVFMGKVLWASGSHYTSYTVNLREWDSTGVIPNFWQEIIPLFLYLKNNVYFFAGDTCAFAGMSAMLSRFRNSNITFCATGMGGLDNDNFMLVDVDSLGNSIIIPAALGDYEVRLWAGNE